MEDPTASAADHECQRRRNGDASPQTPTHLRLQQAGKVQRRRCGIGLGHSEGRTKRFALPRITRDPSRIRRMRIEVARHRKEAPLRELAVNVSMQFVFRHCWLRPAALQSPRRRQRAPTRYVPLAGWVRAALSSEVMA